MKSIRWGDLQWPLLGLLWIFGLYLGYTGFALHAAALGEEASPFDLVYLTLQLISMDSGAVTHPVSWELEVARLLLPVLTAFTALTALASIFRQQIGLFRLNFYRNHILICGLSRKGFLLVEGYRQSGKQVVVIEQDDHNDWLEASRALGAVVILGDATDLTLLRKAGLPNASCVIAVCNDDGINAEVAVRARQLSAGRENNPLRCILHLVDPQLCELLRERERELESHTTLRLELFNVFDRGAQILIQEHPLLPRQNGSSPHLLIVGLGHLGESLILEAARQWQKQRPADGHLRITIVDQEVHTRTEVFQARHPDLADMCQLSSYQMNIHSPEFQRGEFLRGANPQTDIDIAFICLDGDSQGLHAGLILAGLLKNQDIPIVVRMGEKGGLATLLRDEDGGESSFQNLIPFALLDRTCTPDVI